MRRARKTTQRKGHVSWQRRHQSAHIQAGATCGEAAGQLVQRQQHSNQSRRHAHDDAYVMQSNKQNMMNYVLFILSQCELFVRFVNDDDCNQQVDANRYHTGQCHKHIIVFNHIQIHR